MKDEYRLGGDIFMFSKLQRYKKSVDYSHFGW